MAEARAHAQTVLRLRGAALGVAVLPAAVAAVLWAGRATGRAGASGAPDAAAWGWARWTVTVLAVAVLAAVAALAARLRRVPPPPPLSVPVAESSAPELYRLVREVAARMDVPAPGRIALTPDCDSWLEDDADADGAPPALVIGSPFLWWMRVGELRALIAPVVAGSAASADPEITAARRFVRGLDAVAFGRAAGSGADPAALGIPAAGDALGPGSGPGSGLGPGSDGGPRRAPLDGLLSGPARRLLRRCRLPAAELERAVAGWASERAQLVDYGLRVAAQEQVGLVYAGWDRLLSRVALPAWRIGRLPRRLDAGVVSALTELSRRDRLAEGYEARLTERPACDLLEDPGRTDHEVSALAARLFHGFDPAAPGPAPVDWADYPVEVVERIWRGRATALQLALDRLGAEEAAGRGTAGADGPDGPGGAGSPDGPTVARLLDRLRRGDADRLARLLAVPDAAARDAAATEAAAPSAPGHGARGGRELLVEHLSALVCCAAVDTGIGRPGLDWLDGPVLTVGGVRRPDLAPVVAEAVEQADDGPLRDWLAAVGIRMETPVRLS